MKALFIYKYLTLGGVEAVLRARLEGLPKHGLEAHAWFLRDGPGRSIFSGLEERTHVGGLTALRMHLADENYDLASTIDSEEVFPLLISLQPSVAPVLEVHTPYRENQVYLRHLGSFSPRVVLVPSEFQADVVHGAIRGDLPVQVIPNPLRGSFCEPLRSSGPRPPHPVIAWVGRLDRLKNWKLFVRVAKDLLRRSRTVEFVIAGDGGPGTSREPYRFAKKTGVLGHLRWYKGMDHDRVPSLLDMVRHSGGVFVSTSRGESFGMTVAEAMARGCAVVVPESGPFPEFVEHGEHGLLYRPGSVKRAVATIERLLEDMDLRRSLGESARAHILARHSPDVALIALADALRAAASSA